MLLLDILRRARFPEQRKQLFRNTNTAANNLHTHTHTHMHTQTHTHTPLLYS